MIIKNRSRTEIIHDVISLAGGGALKTRIMYGANLSYDMLAKYLDFTIDCGLIEKRLNDEEDVMFFITAKGVEFLSRCDELTAMVNLDPSVKKEEEKQAIVPLNDDGSLFAADTSAEW